jgi:hypothetical protein
MAGVARTARRLAIGFAVGAVAGWVVGLVGSPRSTSPAAAEPGTARTPPGPGTLNTHPAEVSTQAARSAPSADVEPSEVDPGLSGIAPDLPPADVAAALTLDDARPAAPPSAPSRPEGSVPEDSSSGDGRSEGSEPGGAGAKPDDPGPAVLDTPTVRITRRPRSAPPTSALSAEAASEITAPLRAVGSRTRARRAGAAGGPDAAPPTTAPPTTAPPTTAPPTTAGRPEATAEPPPTARKRPGRPAGPRDEPAREAPPAGPEGGAG